MNITVFLGANAGNDPAFEKAVEELGTWIGRSGHTLVYGGSRPGLMGKLAGSVLAAGGTVIGVQAELFVAEEKYDGLTKMIVTKNLSERKRKMIDLGDAFIAFPGGTGTLDEITEVVALASLNEITRPCIFYNVNGYYEGIQIQFRKMIDAGLSSEERLRNIYFADGLNEIQKIIGQPLPVNFFDRTGKIEDQADRTFLRGEPSA